MAKCEDCKRRDSLDGEKYCESCKEKRDHRIKYWIKVCGAFVVVAGVAIVSIIKGNDK